MSKVSVKQMQYVKAWWALEKANEEKHFLDAFDGGISENAIKDVNSRIEKAQKELDQRINELGKAGEEVPSFDPTNSDEMMSYGIDIRTKAQKLEDLNKRATANPHNYSTEIPAPTPGIFDRMKNNRESHSLRDTVNNFGKELNLSFVGLANPNIYEKKLPEGRLSAYIDPKGGTRDPQVVKQYIDAWLDGKIHPENYFSDTDGNLHNLVANFFATKPGTRDHEAAQTELRRHFNITARQILWSDEKYKENLKYFGDELIHRKAVKKSYLTNSPAHIIGSQWNRNVLKEIAWIVVHSYLIDVFLDEDVQYNLIPAGNQSKDWNDYIMSMDDVNPLVKKYFMMDSVGKCIFKEVVDQKHDESPREDTPPFENATVVIDGEFKDVTDVATVPADPHDDPMYNAYIDAMARDTAREERAASPKFNPAEATVSPQDVAKHTFGQLKQKQEATAEQSKKAQAMTR